MNESIKKIDNALFKQTLRRGIIHGRVLKNANSTGKIGRTLEAIKRERTLPDDSFLYRTPVPRFVGGTTGRSGTKWLIRTMERELDANPVVIGEHGMFVLSLFRSAPYEFYQFGGADAARRRDGYLDYFLDQVRTYAFRRTKVYGSGLTGLVRYLPLAAIDRAGEKLRRDVSGVEDFPAIQRAFGDFYLALHNFHAAVIHGGPAEWVNKEPPYGRHADELCAMIPNARLVIMARDGRASALSMYKRGWMSSVRGCMERWRDFAGKTVAAIDRCPVENVLVVKYEDMVTDYRTTLGRVFTHFQIPAEKVDQIIDRGADASLPRPESLDRWKNEVTAEDLAWFEQHCADTMRALGYNR